MNPGPWQKATHKTHGGSYEIRQSDASNADDIWHVRDLWDARPPIHVSAGYIRAEFVIEDTHDAPRPGMMTREEFLYGYAAKLLESEDPASVAAVLYGKNGEAQKRDNELVLGYWTGNWNAKTFVIRGRATYPQGRFTEAERWLEAVRNALAADIRDGK